MNRPLTLTARSEPRVTLRAAAPGDLEDLRAWKNANKAGFFFQKEITPEMQKEWYASYLKRPDDHMFIVEHEGKKAGCMAFRAEGGAVDAYNIIASPEGAGKGLMKAAMALMCSYAAEKYTRNIGCLVLKDNPAVGYYRACGFSVIGDGGDHRVFKLVWSKKLPVPYDVSEG